MATDLENLTTAKSALIVKIAAVIANPQPNYSIGSQSVQWSEYYKMLTDQLKAINILLLAEDPYFIVSQVC